MTPGGHQRVEDLLRERLHTVDGLGPPEAGFELRALRAGRARLKRRQAWTRGLAGAAAAVTVGAIAVPTIAGLRGSDDGGPSASSAVAPPTAEPSVSAGPNVAGKQGAAEGQSPLDPAGPLTQATVARLSSELATTYPDTFTALVLEGTPTPSRVVLHVTAETPAAERRVRDLVSARLPVVVQWSAYSARSCTATLNRVAADLSTLTNQGYAVGSLRCDDDGRVVVPVTNPVTTEQRDLLAKRYGDAVTVVSEPAVPSAATR